MADILETLTSRRSVSKYLSKPVPENLLDEVVEAGLYAPTGMGRQQAVILKITDSETVRTLLFQG